MFVGQLDHKHKLIGLKSKLTSSGDVKSIAYGKSANIKIQSLSQKIKNKNPDRL